MAGQTKDLTYYLNLPYTEILRPDEEGDFVARIEELEGCIAHGKTRKEALDSLQIMKELWIKDAMENGDRIPEPAAEETLPSGKWVQRVPRSLHAKLALWAKRENTSLNQLVVSILSEHVGASAAPEEQIAARMLNTIRGYLVGSYERKTPVGLAWGAPGLPIFGASLNIASPTAGEGLEFKKPVEPRELLEA